MQSQMKLDVSPNIARREDYYVGNAKTSIAYDTYWKFAFERQKIFWNRARRKKGALTNDPILLQYKFTNPYRACDRVSQFLIKDVIYSDSFDVKDTFLRVLLFKLFNKIETWQLLEKEFGTICHKTFEISHFEKFLDKLLGRNTRIYSNAYMMASGCKEFDVKRKHHAHLMLLDKMVKENLPKRIQAAKSMSNAYQLLLSYPMIGQFLAYQYVTDLNYSEITDFSEKEFTIPGPGAKDGIKKCFVSLGNHTESEIIQMMADRQEHEFGRLDLDFEYLGGRKLQYIDIQNLFCETDKYCRVAHPDIQGVSGRSRIKQKYQPKQSPINFFFPPKWNIDMEKFNGSK